MFPFQKLAYFTKRTRTRNQTFRKSRPGPLGKANLMPKFIVMVKKFIFDKLKDADSNYDNSFFKF